MKIRISKEKSCEIQTKKMRKRLLVNRTKIYKVHHVLYHNMCYKLRPPNNKNG